MKSIVSYIAGFISALAFAGVAATTTITTTSGEDARIIVAFGDYLHLGRNATQAEVKGAIATWVTGVVFNYEAEQAKKSAVQATTTINPT